MRLVITLRSSFNILVVLHGEGMADEGAVGPDGAVRESTAHATICYHSVWPSKRATTQRTLRMRAKDSGLIANTKTWFGKPLRARQNKKVRIR